MTGGATRYPLYVISKGRSGDACLTARFLTKDQVPFFLVVEPQEAEAYAASGFSGEVLTLPFSNLGLGSIPARNWVWDHAAAAGAERHWILDDNIRHVMRRYNGVRIQCNAGPALRICEDFVDRYENIAIAGLNYAMFTPDRRKISAFVRNAHVYSCMLILNSLSNRWRGRYNEDTDLCLQVLADGWCTIQFRAFMIQKIKSMNMKGGNTDALYAGDGRLKMARSLERQWPGIVETKRRFGRPQHVVKNAWKMFDTQLKLKPGVDLAALPAVDDHELELIQVREIKHPEVAKLYENFKKGNSDGS